MTAPNQRSLHGGASIFAGSAFGIPVRVHWTFLALVGGVWVLSGFEPGVLLLLVCVFLSVLLHEFGHALVAKRLGVAVHDITFWSLGGMTRMEVPEEAGVEGRIAFAGPAVNFALAGLTLAFGVLAVALGLGEVPTIGEVAVHPVALFISVNLMLGAFNLLPAFPMDGGRILRAWFARSTDWLTATERAVRFGRYTALAVVLLALAGGGSSAFLCTLPIIALFLYVAGGRELLAVRLRHTGSPFPRGGKRFGPFAGGAFGPREARPSEPGEIEIEVLPREERGFSDEDVDRLEGFRGRLRDRRDDA
ncbi:MAG: site-2 protease family protein [Planctomycetota bacterium]